MKTRIFAILAAFSAPVWLSACASVGASSASLGSISSLSASSGSSMRREARADFQDDVRMMAQTAAESGVDAPGLLRNIGLIAREYGIAHWEEDVTTYRAVGEGLRLAGLDEHAFAVLSPRLTGDNHEAARELLDGYRAI